MNGGINWGPEIRVDGVRPEWLGDADRFALKDHGCQPNGVWLGLDTNWQGWEWRDSYRISAIRLPADHPHYATLSHATAPNGGEVGPEVVETLRSAVRRIIARCEAIEDENSDQLGKEQTEASSGFLRGERHIAKSIRRELHDLTRAALLPEQVDSDLVEARDRAIALLSKTAVSNGIPEQHPAIIRIREGRGDHNSFVVDILAAIKRGRALEKEAGR